LTIEVHFEVHFSAETDFVQYLTFSTMMHLQLVNFVSDLRCIPACFTVFKV